MTAHVPVPLLVPDLPAPEALMPYLQRMHAAQQYSNFGPLLREMEGRLLGHFAQNAAVPLALSTVANATLGLELVLAALELPPHSRVLLPSLTFVATATAVLRAGHIPVLADVDADSWLLTPEIARRALREARFDAVMPVAAFGAPHAMAGWHAFQQETGIPVVIDAAAAFGGQWLEAPTGTAVFSLHATKSLPAGEGGFVVSTDAALVARVRQLSNFGINLNPAAKLPVGMLARIGSNAKMSEYHAAVGLASLDRWEACAALRRSRYADMHQALELAAPGALRWQATDVPVAAPTLLCVRLPGAAQRKRLEALCAKRGIGLRRWYQPLLTSMLQIAPECICLPTPVAGAIAADMVGLPFFPGIESAQIVSVARAMGDTLAVQALAIAQLSA
ncbi:DegT/DnrJ/EryC1/StrS aminotransferase [Xylophilus rhododendri]|uniref:DegT/DnrJ/EryC1/StrS aminotransferase n=1 Tax=Xylophilus rhododendri TaxID=2697032 RepID=A0A857J546_9BURK|nr:DegT/DnrJ/EryC1/StrS family aminotransferase [Xylophilus rhododendri]QHI97965.1 DegT/DnrJ/EryC1/StrS aminotransferase [Xylophilus rhododendri]